MTNFLAKNQFWQTFLNSLNCMRLIFILIVKNIFSIKSQRILIRIEWNLFHCDLEVKIFHMNSSWFFRVFDEISSIVHGFEVVGPMFIKFDSSSNNETHRDVIPSSYITYLNTSFQKVFAGCNFQAISLWLFTSPRACNWWIFERS